MKKKYLILMFIVLSLLLLAGCKSGKGSTDGKTKLTIWYYWETPKHQEALNGIISGFNNSQENIEVEAQYIPFADFKKQLSIGASAEDLPDLVIIDNPDHAAYSAMGIFADISDQMKGWEGLDKYFEGPLSSCKYDGGLYGIPFGSNCIALYYDDDLLKKAGVPVPKTWDELRTASKKLTNGKVKGFAFSALQNEEGTFNFLVWQWGAGTSSYEIDNAKGIKSLEFVQNLVKDGSMPKEAINWTQGDVMNQFISGNLAMMLNGPWQVPTMLEQAPDMNWKVALIPEGEKYASDLGGENFGVVNSGNVDETVEFLKYACAPERIKEYINKFGYIASRKDVADVQFSDDDEVMKMFAKQMEFAYPRGPHAKWPEISNAISLAFNKVITGVSSPAEAAKEAQSAIGSIIK